MATAKSNGTDKALAVIDINNNKPISLPLNVQREIMAPIVNLLDWIMTYSRTGGVPNTSKAADGNEFKYYFYPKQTNVRNIDVQVDTVTGKISGGIFGAPDSDGLFDGPKSTMGDYLISELVELSSANYLNHKIPIKDLTTEGLKSLIANKLANWTAEMAQNNLMTLKAAMVAAFGTLGNAGAKTGWEYDQNGVGKRVTFALPVADPSAPKIGDRVLSKDYTVDAAGGEAAIKDIIDTLIYRETIGLKGGAEPTYGLQYGAASDSAIISLSSNINKAILMAVEKSSNGFIPGVGVDNSTGKVTSISYNGKVVKIGHIVTDMPDKKQKAFNWFIIERGRQGAIAMPSTWTAGVQVYSENMLTKTVESIGLLIGMKILQPELMFSSFAKTKTIT